MTSFMRPVLIDYKTDVNCIDISELLFLMIKTINKIIRFRLIVYYKKIVKKVIKVVFKII